MDFTELASRVDPASPNTGARSREPLAKRQRTASVERTRPSNELRRPSSFERIRPPQFYERGRTGSYEQRPRSTSSSGWRFASSSRSSRGSFVSLIDPKTVLGRDMEEQRERDISLLNERSPTVSRFGNPRRSGRKKQPSEGYNWNRRPEVPSRVTQGTMVIYRERKAEDQPTEDSLRKSREGIFESTADVDRETLLIRKRRDTKGERTKDLPGSPHGSDFDPTASSSKGALVLYQGKKASDETSQALRKRYRRNSSDTISISQPGTLVIHREETSVETAQQLAGRYRNASVDTTYPQTDTLAISNEAKPKDESAEELPERARRLVERNTNDVEYVEIYSDSSERDLPRTSINKGLPHEEYLSTSEAGSLPRDITVMSSSLEVDLDDLSDESSRPKKGRRASIGDSQESFSDDDITTRRNERRTLNNFRKHRYDGNIRSWSDNRRPSDDFQYYSPESSPHNGAKTRGSIRTYEGKAPSIRRRRKGKVPQRKEPAPEKPTKRRVEMGPQQTTDNNNNGYGDTNLNLARLEGPDSHHAPGTESPLAGSKQLIRGKASPADMGMRTLLVYRAVLFAMLCALAADTSCVYETELGRRVVQVL